MRRASLKALRRLALLPLMPAPLATLRRRRRQLAEAELAPAEVPQIKHFADVRLAASEALCVLVQSADIDAGGPPHPMELFMFSSTKLLGDTPVLLLQSGCHRRLVFRICCTTAAAWRCVGCEGVVYGGFHTAAEPPASAEEQRSLWITMFGANGATHMLLVQVRCHSAGCGLCMQPSV